MKPLLTLAFCAMLLLTGCARHYTITLNSGSRITAHGKPRLEKGYYVYKDVNGEKNAVAVGRVREISPSSMASARGDSGFKAEPTK